ncbi:low specificity L-threonine aldolase [Mammaliicoccus sp. Dog046]|uniref:threonine aldolase family protein n=1 Tax=Mammaliicoccus sp. Dog046 TaxID=3034233 RepID=UPI002B2586B7|nr:low specificity L-threonine aldolase [Mammaliicoccus sp. Dog046]WQK84751.1 low specificity L-threonine aldolase [Mammaliicoccus sp. Dog046]
MISFENDYLEGAHTNVLAQLVKTNMIQESGYGMDNFTVRAKEKIKNVIDCPEATVKFLVGGTQTNQVVINSILKPYEGVIAADTGHISTHEAGAIEYTGHKILSIPSNEGKITAIDIDNLVRDFYNDKNYRHMVFPGMVYISFPTEYGTLYSREELITISNICKKHDLPLYIDGARLGYGLASYESELTIKDIAKYSDIFYIGGTKIGALCGEAVVFTNKNEPSHFTTLIKQHGALLAKSRLVSIQFLELFNNNLYFEISRHAVDMSLKIKKSLLQKGYKLYYDSPTNQQFIVVNNSKLQELEEKIKFSFWEKYDEEHTVIRFATSWATKEENVDFLIDLL